MDTQMILNMLSGVIEKMSDDELEKTLKQAKTLLGVQDYERLKQIIKEKKRKVSTA